MPAELWEDQYELSPADSVRNDGLVFGTEDTGYLTIERPQHTGGDVRNGDQDRAYEDGAAFSRDTQGGKSVEFTIGVLTDLRNRGVVQTGDTPLRTNLDYLGQFEARWTDERLRSDPKAMGMLRTCEGGRTSRAYGRPRRYDETVAGLTRQGYTPIACDFALTDGRWYDDDEQSAVVSLVTPPEGGWEFPAVFPLTSSPETQGEEVIRVGGTVPTWPVIEFFGPSINPSVRFLSMGLVVGLNVSIPYDQSIVIDPRPWRRSVLRASDSASFRGDLSAQTPMLRDIRMRTGEWEVQYRATDASGTSRAVIRWRNARKRP